MSLLDQFNDLSIKFISDYRKRFDKHDGVCSFEDAADTLKTLSHMGMLVKAMQVSNDPMHPVASHTFGTAMKGMKGVAESIGDTGFISLLNRIENGEAFA